jgi:uncharacterized protein (TIGR00299 family) protein
MNSDRCESARTIFIEPFAGISGDMFLGALLDLGLSLDWLRQQLSLLPLTGYDISVRKCSKAGIQATKFDVFYNEHDHDGPAAHGPHHRAFREIRQMIGGSALSSWVKEKAIAAFEKLAFAEGKIHGRNPDEVHFHEVGAVDSIIDIVGAMIAIKEYLPAAIVCAPVNVGQGTLECRHGVYPVPGPATLELLRGVPIYSNSLPGELTTPTGAALLVTLVERFEPLSLMRAQASGYGAGTRDIPGAANVLRVTLGEQLGIAGEPADEQVAVIEAAIDDLNPQVYGYLFERALSSGALDVYLTPIQMKKNRPGVELTVLCGLEKVGALARMILTETTTLGLRYRLAWRKTLERRYETVATKYGEIRIKVALLDGERVNFVPEYEDCRRLAAESGIPLKEIMAVATSSYLTRSRQAEGSERS